MNHERKIRSCNRSRAPERQKPCRSHRQICIHLEREEYNRIWALRQQTTLLAKAIYLIANTIQAGGGE